MVNVTEKYKEHIKKSSRSFECKITIGDRIFYNEDIVDIIIDGNIQPQEGFMVGSVASQMLDLTLLNKGDTIYTTNPIKVEIGLKIDNAIEYILMGIYNIDDVEKTDYTIKFTAYDNMMKFETPYFSSLGDNPTLQQVVNELATKTGVQFTGSLPSYMVKKLEDFTCREILSYVASVCGGNAAITRDGKFTIIYPKDINYSITGDNYIDFKREEVKYKIGKVTCQIEEKEAISKGDLGTDSMELLFENPWVTESILQDIYDRLKGFEYLGYSMKWQGDIALDLGDIITCTDVKGVVRKLPILSQKLTYTGGLTSEISAKGESKNKNSFSSSGSIGKKVDRVVTEVALVNKALVDYARINDADIVNLKAETAKIQNLEVETAGINNLLAGNITAKNIATGAITAGSGIIAEGAIGNAEISSLSANKIQSGTVDTSLVTIASKDNSITLTGNQLMVNEGESNRVVLGKYNINDKEEYGLLVRKKDGKTTILDGDGVHNAGLTSDAVRDNVVAEDANILGHKLNINSVVREINNKGTETIKGTKVQVGDRTLDVELSTQQNTITEQGKEIINQKSQIQAMDNRINLKIDTQKYNKDMEGVNTSLNKNTTELGLLKDQINLKVSSTEVDKKINEISIGGRNLVKNSSGNLGDNSHWTSAFIKYDNNGYNGKPSLYIERSGATSGESRFIGSQTLTTKTILKTGEELTLSAWVYMDDSIIQDKDNELFLRCYYGNQFMDICRINLPKTLSRNTWTYVEVSNKAPRDFEKITINIALGLNGKVKVSNIMLVEGNKSLLWAPSPEDLEYSVNKYTDGKITTINNFITSLSSEVNVLKNQINLKVSSSEVDTKISNIQVGGVNKIPKTDFSKTINLSVWSTWGYWEYKPFGDKGALKVSSKSHPKNTVGGIVSPKVIGGLQKDKEYCISIKTTSSSNTTKLDYCYILDLDTNVNERLPVMVVNQWDLDIDKALSYIVFKPTKEYPNCKILIGKEAGEVDNPNITGFLLKDVQLEEGNKCTPWSPAPGDIAEEFNKLETNINQKVSEIKIEQDKITSTVSSVQGTLNNKADKGQLTGLESKLTQTVDAFKFEFNKKINNNVTVINEDGITIKHSDGSYSKLESKGLMRYSAGEAKEYFYLSDVTTRDITRHVPAGVTDDLSFFRDYWYLTLPDKYKGKNPKFWITLSNIDSNGESVNFIVRSQWTRVLEWDPSLARIKVDVSISGIHYYNEKINGKRYLIFDDFSPATLKHIDYRINVMSFA